MNLLLLLAVAVPLSCLAFLSGLAFVGVMTLGAVINVIGIVGTRLIIDVEDDRINNMP